MTAKRIFTWAFWTLYGVSTISLAYAVYWVHDDTTKMFARRNTFIEQCETGGNHLEERGHHETYVYGCYEGPPSKLVKKFQ